MLSMILRGGTGKGNKAQVIGMFRENIGVGGGFEGVEDWIFLEGENFVLGIPWNVCWLSNDHIVSGHEFLGEYFEVTVCPPVVVPEVLVFGVLVGEVLLPKLEIGKYLPIKDMVMIEDSSWRVHSCEDEKPEGVNFALRQVNFGLELKLKVDVTIEWLLV